MFLFDGTAAQSTPIIGVLLTLVRAAWLALSEQHNITLTLQKYFWCSQFNDLHSKEGWFFKEHNTRR